MPEDRAALSSPWAPILKILFAFARIPCSLCYRGDQPSQARLADRLRSYTDGKANAPKPARHGRASEGGLASANFALIARPARAGLRGASSNDPYVDRYIRTSMNQQAKKTWVGIPPWIILGSAVILSLIFIYWTMENINKQKENMSHLLSEKGAALIRSFEAGARTGMMGMMGLMEREGGGFRLQTLLTETAQQHDIVYLIVTDEFGTILAHNDPAKIGETHGSGLDLEHLARAGEVESRQVKNSDGTDTFEVFRRFSPTQRPRRRQHDMMMSRMMRQPPLETEDIGIKEGQIIFVGLDMERIDAARREDHRHTVVMAVILLLSGFAAIFSLFLAQAYRSTKTSLTSIKAFSDNLVENMPIGLMAVDSDGTIASFNQTAGAVLQLSADEILGGKASEVLPNPLWRLVDQSEEANSAIEKELDCPIADGRVIPLDVSVSLLEGDDGIFLGHIILFRDMTEVQNLKREIETTQRLA